jgi:transcriptional regulator with XRE-family HTH domain
MKPSDLQIGENLRISRELAGFSKARAARALGMRRPSIGEIERGTRPAKAREVQAMAELYGAQPRFVLAGEGPRDEQLVTLIADELRGLSADDLERIERAVRIAKTRQRFPSRSPA